MTPIVALSVAVLWGMACSAAMAWFSAACRRRSRNAPDVRGDLLVGGVWILAFSVSFVLWIVLRLA